MSRTVTPVSVASKSHKLKTYSKHNHGAFHYFLSDKWRAPSKLLTNPLEAKLPEYGLQPMRIVGVPLLPEVSRSLTGIDLELLHYVKSTSIRKAQTSHPQDAIPMSCQGSCTGFKSARFLTSRRGTV